MEINLTPTQIRVIKKITGEPDASPVVQKAVDEWYETLVRHTHRQMKSLAEITDDIDKNVV